MDILITGANGFVGRQLVEDFSADSDLDPNLFLTGRTRDLENLGELDRKFFPADITRKKEVLGLRSIKKVDVVVHAAGLAHQPGGQTREKFFETNVRGTENVLKLTEFLGGRHFILVSSVSVYGSAANKENGGIDENFECRPEGFYAESKLAAEEKAREFCLKKKIPLTVLRPATVVGEGDRGNVFRLIRALDKGRFFWIGRGQNSKTLIYKGDLARACSQVIKTPSEEPVEIYNVTGGTLRMREIVSILARQLGKKDRSLFLPPGPLRFLLNLGKNKVKRLRDLDRTLEKWLSDEVYSGKKFERGRGFSPATPVAEALRREVLYYKSKK
ncbi:MAG: NAD-dependent epimerase/dehydratase family protein [Pyrinomonadaceae bacterium]